MSQKKRLHAFVLEQILSFCWLPAQLRPAAHLGAPAWEGDRVAPALGWPWTLPWMWLLWATSTRASREGFLSYMWIFVPTGVPGVRGQPEGCALGQLWHLLKTASK